MQWRIYRKPISLGVMTKFSYSIDGRSRFNGIFSSQLFVQKCSINRRSGVPYDSRHSDAKSGSNMDSFAPALLIATGTSVRADIKIVKTDQVMRRFLMITKPVLGLSFRFVDLVQCRKSKSSFEVMYISRDVSMHFLDMMNKFKTVVLIGL